MTVATPSRRQEILQRQEQRPPIDFEPESVPLSLTEKDRWVLWNWVWNGKKWNKIPLQVDGRRNASSTDPATWTTFSAAVTAAQHLGIGIGFVFDGDGIVGVDYDDCRDPNSGAVADWAADGIASLDSYTEVSPSGTGLKVFLIGKLPAGCRKQYERPEGGELEVYETGRFFTVTGHRAPGTPDEVHNRHEELNAVIEVMRRNTEPRGNLSSYRIDASKTPESSHADDIATIDAALDVLDPDARYIDWIKPGMAIFSVDPSPAGLARWDNWSRRGSKYVEGEPARKWASFKSDGVGIATLCSMADATGRDWRPKRTTPRNHVAAIAPVPLPEPEGITEDDTRDNTVDGDPGQLHPNLIHAGGFLGDFVVYTLRTAPRPQPEFALAGALCVLSALTGRKIRDTSGIRGNIYAVCCGETSGGKDWPRTVAKRLLTIADAHECLLEDVKSGPGVTAALNVHPVRLVLWDEFGRALAGMTSAGKNAPWLATLMTALLKMFTSAGSAYFGEAQADASKITTIHDPHLSVLGSATEVGFFAALNEDVVTNGCLNRSLVFHGIPGVRLVDAADEAVPESLVRYAQWWKGYSPGGNLHGHTDGPPATRLLRYSELAQAHLRAFIELCEDRRESIPHEWERALRGRQVELAKRLAMLHAVSLYSATEVIDVNSVAWACEVVEHCVSRLVWHASTRISANPYEAQLKELVRVIQEAGPNGMTQTSLARRFQRINARVRSELLHHAYEAGHIYSREEETSGRKRVRYIAHNPISKAV